MLHLFDALNRISLWGLQLRLWREALRLVIRRLRWREAGHRHVGIVACALFKSLLTAFSKGARPDSKLKLLHDLSSRQRKPTL